MKKIMVFVWIAILWVGGAGNLSAQIVYDLQTDWVWNTNPNGPWSYGHSADMTDPREFLVNENNESWLPDTCDVWWAREYMQWPLIWKADGFSDGHSFDGEVLLQAWGSGEASVVRFIAPVAGYFDIHITFYYRYSSVQNVILINDAVVLDVTNADYSYDELGRLRYHFSLTNYWISAGDVIDVGVRDITAGNNCKIALIETISEYTEPVIQCEDLGSHHPADLNHDCYFDMEDLLILINNWLACNDPTDPACSLAAY